jgi:integration host factor subunit beta
MIRSELINRLAAHFPQFTTKDTELAVKAILEALSNTLAKGGRIEIRGFGSFRLNYRSPRTACNPRTREAVPVPAKAVPHFLAGKELRTKVDSGR